MLLFLAAAANTTLLWLQNERLFSRIREQEERTRLLTSFVLQQQTFISHLLRQQLPAALRQLELQRQQLEARQAFDAAVAAAEAGDNAAADTAEKRQLLPSLQQLAFVPKSWWSSFVRGTDYPCVSVLLPQHLRPSRDSSNSNSYLHSATERAAKAAATASPQPQQQHDLHEPGESLPDMDELDASLQQHGNQQQQQQHKKSTRKGSTAWTSAVCPEVLEEAGVVDYSSILCPHYIRRELLVHVLLLNILLLSFTFVHLLLWSCFCGRLLHATLELHFASKGKSACSVAVLGHISVNAVALISVCCCGPCCLQI